MLPANIEHIDSKLLQSLVDAGTMEALTLDYKLELYSHDDRSKHSLLADVAAMANTRGGDIVLGIGEGKDSDGKSTGVAERLVGLDGNLDNETLWIQQVVRSGLEPAPQIDLQIVRGPFPDGPILVLRVSRAYNGPVVIRETRRFYVRRGSQNQLIDRVYELRRLFLAFEEHRNWVRHFRSERIAVAMQGTGPLPSPDVPFLVCHLIPGNPTDDELGFSINVLQSTAQFPFLGGISHLLNLDGVVRYPATRTGEYGLAFRSGALELVIIVGAMRDGQASVWGSEINKWVIRFLETGQKAYSALGLSTPVYLCLTLIGAKHSPLVGPPRDFPRSPMVFDRDPVMVPEFMLTEWPERPADLRPILDLLWQAGGHLTAYGLE